MKLFGTLLTASLALALCQGYADAPKSGKHHFTFAGKRLAYNQDDVVVSQVALSGEQSEGRMTIQEEIWKPHFVVGPHIHKTHAEVFYVLGGQIEWTVNGETHAMNTGDLCYIPANAVHSVKVLGGKDAKILFVFEPGGYEVQAMKEQTYTAEQKKDPKLKQELREAGDFHPIPTPATKK